MKRFVFRYQTLLEVRERQQAKEEEVLQRLLGAQEQERLAVLRLEAEAEEQRAAFSGVVQGRVDVDTVLTMHDCLAAKEREILRQRQAHDLACARSENQREILLAALQAAEVLRKLKERDWNAWRQALERAETAQLDELATLRHTRRAL
ncbi:MAG: flagellar FliJ family protein [Candidatus Sericytochromatia bacterium]|nr:flagellar FliJ family protein [Candidatus Sericytochromatia bacterium]